MATHVRIPKGPRVGVWRQYAVGRRWLYVRDIKIRVVRVGIHVW